jgi:dimethylargininase
MKFNTALVKIPAETFSKGVTTHQYGDPDLQNALIQHEKYCEALRKCGLKVIPLEPDLLYPDSTFVEDVAVIGDGFAVITNPGANSRKGEIYSVEKALTHLRRFKKFYHIMAPGTVDGGDICEADSLYYIGISDRTNEEGGRQLAIFLNQEGYDSTFVDIRGIKTLLHLKSGIAYLNRNNMVVIDELANREEFKGLNVIRVRPEENYAANCVLVNDYVLVADGFPYLHETLEHLGYRLLVLAMSEFQKMDGGLSCLSLRF